jgi:hypothetical protein
VTHPSDLGAATPSGPTTVTTGYKSLLAEKFVLAPAEVSVEASVPIPAAPAWNHWHSKDKPL